MRGYCVYTGTFHVIKKKKMGKGDKKTKRGKIFRGSYGKRRLRKRKQSGISNAPKRIKLINNKDQRESNTINQAIFPILSKDENGYFFIGTGFFINELGWFITAKHVAIDNEKPINPFIVIQVVNEEEFQPRIVKGFWYHETADVIVGKLLPMKTKEGNDLTNPALILKTSLIKNQKEIFTYAYPDSKIDTPEGRFQKGQFAPKYYYGKIQSISNRNDAFFKGICIQSNMLVKGGASGGPVFNNNGYVVGINTSGYALIEGQEPISFTTPIQDAFDVEVPFSDGGEVKKVPLKALIELGGVIVDK